MVDRNKLLKMENVFKSIGSLLDDIERDLRAKAPSNTGKLKKSIQADLNETEDGFIIDISMEQYGLYQDKGVNGTKKSWGSPYSFRKQPPSSAFKSYTSSLSGQFLIARSVYRNGIKPKNFIDPALIKAEKKILEYSLEDIEDYINKKWNNI